MVCVRSDDLIGKLREVVLELESQLLDREIEMIRELIDAAEPVVAYEILCSQLYEHDAGVQTQAISVLSELGSSMDLVPRQWQILRVID